MEAVIGPWQISVQRAWPTNTQLANKYDSAAPTWHNRIRRLGYIEAYRHLFQNLIEEGALSHLQDSSALLDSGIGTGAFSLALAQTTPAKPEIFGVDLSAEMAERAENLLTTAGINANIRQGNIQQLPYLDNQFDMVMAAHVLEHLPNPTQGINEMVRVLKPGSPLLLSVTRPGVLGTALQWRWGNGTFKPGQLTQMLADAGLSDIRVYAFKTGLTQWSSIAYLGVKQ